MSDEVGTPLGQAVRTAVEGAGMTVEQVSARTRIRSTLIRDLQDGRTASSGGDVYARGHLKAIAQATGADPELLLAAFERDTGAPAREPLVLATVPVVALRAGSLALPRAQAPERRGPRWGLAVGGAAVLLIGVLAVGNAVGGADTGPAPDALAGAAAPTPGPSTSPTPAPVATIGPGAVASRPPVSGAALRVRVLGGDSWVLVTSGGSKVFEGVLPDGTVRDFNDPATLSVKVGNAGAVSLICGGKDVAAGGNGQVKSFSCAQAGLVAA